MSQFNIQLTYPELQMIKHSLQSSIDGKTDYLNVQHHYNAKCKHDNNVKQDIEQEQRLLNKINKLDNRK